MGFEKAEMRRCEHIKTNGTQCGAPALRGEKFCYYHRENQAERIEVKADDGKTSALLVPQWEDAASIQVMVRKVAILLLEGKIDGKRAGQVLYALQIASTNLKRMDEQKPRPSQVVVDTDKVGATELGLTPWTREPRGWELEDAAVGYQGTIAAKLKEQVFSLRKTLEYKQNEAKRIAKYILKEVNEEPKADYDRLKWLMGIMASKVENDLGGAEWD